MQGNEFGENHLSHNQQQSPKIKPQRVTCRVTAAANEKDTHPINSPATTATTFYTRPTRGPLSLSTQQPIISNHHLIACCFPLSQQAGASCFIHQQSDQQP